MRLVSFSFTMSTRFYFFLKLPQVIKCFSLFDFAICLLIFYVFFFILKGFFFLFKSLKISENSNIPSIANIWRYRTATFETCYDFIRIRLALLNHNLSSECDIKIFHVHVTFHICFFFFTQIIKIVIVVVHFYDI